MRRLLPQLHNRRSISHHPTTRSTIEWTAEITSHVQSHRPVAALLLFLQMLRHPSSPPNAHTFTSISLAASNSRSLHLPKLIHSQTLTRGLASNPIVATSLLNAYSKCGDIDSSKTIFDRIHSKTVVTWNSMISGYVNSGLGGLGLELFYDLRCVEMGETDEYVFATVLTACALTGDVLIGTQVHGCLVKGGFGGDCAVRNALCNMYFRCGGVELAEKAVERGDEGVMFSVLRIKGYAFNRRYEDVIRSVRCCRFAEVVVRDLSVFTSVISACASLSLLGIGRQVHGFVVKFGCHRDGRRDCVVTTSALIDMYCRCGSVEEARLVFGDLVVRDVSHWNAMVVGSVCNGLIEDASRLFDVMSKRNVVSWTAMVSGYARFGIPEEGIRLVSRLDGDALEAHEFASIFTACLDACSCLAVLDVGKELHAYVKKRITAAKLHNGVMLETSLVDMYSKCGSLDYARKVFDKIANKNVVTWTSMIAGYASHGSALEALKVFEDFVKTGLRPNEVTFVAALSACNHCGLVEDGVFYFKMMRETYGISPSGDHYSCMVDMLARAGKLAEAMDLAEEITYLKIKDYKGCNFDSNELGSIWGAILSGCRLHGELDLGSKVAQRLLENNHHASDTYISLSNIYAAAEKWDKVFEVRKKWKRFRVSQDPGYSRI